MILKNQVTSVELSNKLKLLGVKSSSQFYRDSTRSKEDEICVWESHDGDFCEDNVACYTAAELGEMLPKGKSWETHFFTKENVSFCENKTSSYEKDYFEAPTEADARAKMLIYLIENKLIKLI